MELMPGLARGRDASAGSPRQGHCHAAPRARQVKSAVADSSLSSMKMICIRTSPSLPCCGPVSHFAGFCLSSTARFTLSLSRPAFFCWSHLSVFVCKRETPKIVLSYHSPAAWDYRRRSEMAGSAQEEQEEEEEEERRKRKPKRETENETKQPKNGKKSDESRHRRRRRRQGGKAERERLSSCARCKRRASSHPRCSSLTRYLSASHTEQWRRDASPRRGPPIYGCSSLVGGDGSEGPFPRLGTVRGPVPGLAHGLR